MTTNFFKKLYEADDDVEPEALLNLFDDKVSEEINEALCREFSDDEISDALFQIGPLKAPGRDGFPARFFQRNWAELKHDVIVAVKNFFANGIMPEGINDTVIVLIPKGKSPENLQDFRPISLCNVIYKIISKCLVNRLRPFLDELILESQSAFIPGRLIADNASIAFECFYRIQQSKNERDNHCAYKLDLTKAYDRVEWKYLEEVLLKYGFCQKWVSWIMSCVRSVRYAVKLNGEMLDSFYPSRGLRQGDPLSPYLFLFVAEGLSRALEAECSISNITPLKVARGAPGISHLLFADDSLLFFKATGDQATSIKSALNVFQKGTGQLLSPSKCSILLSKVCPEHIQEEIMHTLDINSSTFEEKYLGLPTPKGRMKDSHFQPIFDRFTKRLTDWAERYMSYGEKKFWSNQSLKPFLLTP